MGIELRTDYFYNESLLEYTMTSIDLSFFVVFSAFIIFLMFWKLWK